jgi:hypothetical protein
MTIMGCKERLTQAFSVKHLTQAFLGEIAAIGGSRVWTRWHATAAIGAVQLTTARITVGSEIGQYLAS